MKYNKHPPPVRAAHHERRYIMEYTKSEIIDYIDILLHCCDDTFSSELDKTTVLRNLKPSSYIYVLTCIEDYIKDHTN